MCFPQPTVPQSDHYRRAVEHMMTHGRQSSAARRAMCSSWNQNPERREALREHAEALRGLNVDGHAPDGTYLFDDFGWAGAELFTVLVRWFLEYYEDFDLPRRPNSFDHACAGGATPAPPRHPPRNQIVAREEIVRSSITTTPRADSRMNNCRVSGARPLRLRAALALPSMAAEGTNTGTTPRTGTRRMAGCLRHRTSPPDIAQPCLTKRRYALP